MTAFYEGLQPSMTISRLITDFLKASLQNHNVYQSKTFSAMIH